tara:strand:- start:401 stop:700 length:300 start_codon:yes stop_codon:yes gene_type:complete
VSKSIDKCVDFLTWLTYHKVDSNSNFIPEIRTILDKSTFRYIKNGGNSVDDILVMMKEQGWFYENEEVETQCTIDTLTDFIERNPLTPSVLEYRLINNN